MFRRGLYITSVFGGPCARGAVQQEVTGLATSVYILRVIRVIRVLPTCITCTCIPLGWIFVDDEKNCTELVTKAKQRQFKRQSFNLHTLDSARHFAQRGGPEQWTSTTSGV